MLAFPHGGRSSLLHSGSREGKAITHLRPSLPTTPIQVGDVAIHCQDGSPPPPRQPLHKHMRGK